MKWIVFSDRFEGIPIDESATLHEDHWRSIPLYVTDGVNYGFAYLENEFRDSRWNYKWKVVGPDYYDLYFKPTHYTIPSFS